jgi:hypothetical protein
MESSRREWWKMIGQHNPVQSDYVTQLLILLIKAEFKFLKPGFRHMLDPRFHSFPRSYRFTWVTTAARSYKEQKQ